MKQTLLYFFLLISTSNFAQAIAELKFEEAETAFNQGNYELTIKKVDEFEKAVGGMSDKSLFLRVLSQNKLFNPAIFYNDEKQFPLYNSLSANAEKYIKAMESKGLDDKFKEIYAISEKLKEMNLPKDKTTYQKEKLRLTKEKQDKQKAIFDQEEGCKKNFSELTIDNLPFDITIEDFQKQYPNILGEKPEIEKRREYDYISDYDIYHTKNISFQIRYNDAESFGEFLPDNFTDDTKNIIVLVSKGIIVGYQKQFFYFKIKGKVAPPTEFDKKYIELVTKYGELSKCANANIGNSTRSLFCEDMAVSFTTWDFNNKKIIIKKQNKLNTSCWLNSNIYSVTLRICKSEIDTKL